MKQLRFIEIFLFIWLIFGLTGCSYLSWFRSAPEEIIQEPIETEIIEPVKEIKAQLPSFDPQMVQIQINFDVNDFTIKSYYHRQLNGIVELFNKYPDQFDCVEIQGHTDSTHTEEFNQKLSEKRAYAVLNYLKNHNLHNYERFVARGYAFRNPLASNDSPEGRAQNRRVVIKIIPCLDD